MAFGCLGKISILYEKNVENKIGYAKLKVEGRLLEFLMIAMFCEFQSIPLPVFV